VTTRPNAIEREINRLQDWEIAVSFGEVAVKDKGRVINKLLLIENYWCWQHEQFLQEVR